MGYRAFSSKNSALLNIEYNLCPCDFKVSPERLDESGGYVEEDMSAIDRDSFQRLDAKQFSQTL